MLSLCISKYRYQLGTGNLGCILTRSGLHVLTRLNVFVLGNLTIYIKCFDRFGAYSKSEATVVVTDVTITDADFANFADENKKSIESGNYDKFFG